MDTIAHIANFFNAILNIGIDQNIDSVKKIIIQIVNLICAAAIFMCLVGMLINGWNQQAFTFFPILGMMFTCSLGLFLNAQKQYETAKLVTLIGTGTLQFINLQFINTDSVGAELTFIPLALLSPVVLHKKWTKWTSFCYLLLLLGLVLSTRSYTIDMMFLSNLLLISAGFFIVVIKFFNYLTKTVEDLRINNDLLKTQNVKQEELINQNNLKTELLGVLSHDLKGPASAFNQLSKKVSLLLKKERYAELEELGQYFELAGDQIFHDIDRLLNWTIAQKENIVIRESNFSPYNLIEGIIEKLFYQVKDKEIEFKNNIPKDLLITTDSHLLEIILKNLIINAANNVGNKPTVIISHNTLSDVDAIIIQNPGTAIDMAIVEQARAGRYRKSKHGHGLGLGICFSLIMFLEGQINFESQTKEGTTVRIGLPKK